VQYIHRYIPWSWLKADSNALHHFNIQTSVADPFHADPDLDPYL
jgi:hypothetical protein